MTLCIPDVVDLVDTVVVKVDVVTVAAMVSAFWKTSVSFILLLSIIRISLLFLAVDAFVEDIIDVIGAVDAEQGVATVEHL